MPFVKRLMSRRVVMALLAAALGWMGWSVVARQPTTIAPPPESEVELTATEKGTTYKVHGGQSYRVEPRTGRWELVQRVYDPGFYAKNYVERDGAIFRKDDAGSLVPVRRRFADGFEGTARLADLIGPERGWTSCALQSPKAPTVADYVALRKRIITGTAVSGEIAAAAGLEHVATEGERERGQRVQSFMHRPTNCP